MQAIIAHRLQLNLLVILAYLTTGYLGLQFAVPPGYATAIWAPSGIALAVLIIYGLWTLPAIFLSSFLINYYVAIQASGIYFDFLYISTALLIGFGAALQALLGWWLVKKFIGLKNPLYYPKTILIFALLTGPVSCLIAATIGNLALLSFGILASFNFMTSWLTWWIGDAIGVLIFTPALLILFGKPKAIWRCRIVPVLLPLGLAFTMVVFAHSFYSHAEYQRVKEHFMLITKGHIYELTDTLLTQNNQKLKVTASSMAVDFDKMTPDRETNQIHASPELTNLFQSAFNQFNDYAFLALQPVNANASSPTIVIYNSRPVRARHDQFQLQFSVNINQKSWLLTAISKPEFIVKEYSWEVWTSLSATLFFCVLINIILMILYGQRYLIQFMADKQADELNAEKTKNQLLFNVSEQGVILINADYNITYINPAASQLLTFDEQTIVGQSINLILSNQPTELKACVLDGAPLYQALHFKHMININDAIFYQSTGQSLWVDYSCMPVVIHGTVDGALILFNDVTERLHNQNELINLAHYDTLTKLPNRLSFSNYLKQAIEQANHRHGAFCVCFIDIDNFKNVNDNFGHSTGDGLLKHLPKVMKPYLRSIDYLARLSGDEFGLILQDIKDETQVANILDRIISAFEQAIVIEGILIKASISIGVALYPDDGKDSQNLVNKADQAMYSAKENGKATYFLYKKA